MKNELITKIEQEMLPYLDNLQMKELKKVLEHNFFNIDISYNDLNENDDLNNENLLEKFISSKHVEGCSEKSLKYYKMTITNMYNVINKDVRIINTDDLRKYLDFYQKKGNVSKVTIDNVRRIFSSFFAWLEDEDYILKSPVRRIHKVKVGKTVKETYSDEMLELMRDNTDNIRDLAIIDLLSSTGIRVGELVNLDVNDIDFNNRECVVSGKGDKERKVYFDARTKIHLSNYLKERKDNNEALFVTLLAPFNRLKISGVEIRLRNLGEKLNIPKVYPHKFRRTLATRAIDKGMPIEQVQRLLGHTKIDTTLQYAMVNDSNVKISHNKYIA